MKHPASLVLKSFERRLFVEFDVLANPLRRTIERNGPANPAR
jgi:hypothetical protein